MRAGFAALIWHRLVTLAGMPPADTPLRFPNGLAHWIDFTWALHPTAFHWMAVIMTIACVLYVVGIAFPVAATLLFLGYLTVGTLINSNGSISHYYQLITLMLGFQALAAWVWAARHPWKDTWGWLVSSDLHSLVIRTTIQVLAANYVLCGISKVIASRGAWTWNNLYMPVEFAKIQANQYYETLQMPDMGIGGMINDLCLQHPWMCLLVYSPGIIFELLAFLMLLGRRWLFVFGLLIIAMHGVIKLVMGLNFQQHQWIFLIFAVNLPYWIAWLSSRFLRAASRQPAAVPESVPVGWNIPAIFARIGNTVTAVPLIFITIVLGLIFRENYPISHWPMYGNITPRTGYTYLVDGTGDPIAIQVFQETGARLARQFNKEKDSESKRARLAGLPKNDAVTDQTAGIHLLERLAQRLTPEQKTIYRELGLMNVDLTLQSDRKLKKDEHSIARISLVP